MWRRLLLAAGASFNLTLAKNEAALAALRQNYGVSEGDTLLPGSWGDYSADNVSALHQAVACRANVPVLADCLLLALSTLAATTRFVLL